MKSRLLEGKVAFDAASLDWLQDAGHKIYGQNFNARKILFAGFASIYSVVRLCHGTRAEDPASFYQSAILPSNIEKLNQRAIQLFGDSPKVMETIKSLEWYTEHNAGRIWTCLDPCECLIYDYCWKGSEYLRTIANHVGMPEKVRSLGTPTLLEFDVSVKEIGEDKVNSIAGTAIGSLYKNWKRPGSIKSPVPFAIPLLSPVLPKQIREVRQLQERPCR